MWRVLVAVCLLGGVVAARRSGDSIAATQAVAARSHTVRLANGRFEPATLEIQPGDTVRFVNGAGGPHNVAFREATGAAATALRAAMQDTIADLSGPLLITAGESYTIVFDRVPAGRYPFVCVPHMATMKGLLIVGTPSPQ